MNPLRYHNIGGGIVRHSFTSGDRRLNVGTRLSKAEIYAIPEVNRQCMIRNEHLEVWPDQAESASERFLIHRGGGLFDVIAGSKLNAKPLSKDEAETLASNRRSTHA